MEHCVMCFIKSSFERASQTHTISLIYSQEQCNGQRRIQDLHSIAPSLNLSNLLRYAIKSIVWL